MPRNMTLCVMVSYRFIFGLSSEHCAMPVIHPYYTLYNVQWILNIELDFKMMILYSEWGNE